MTELSRLTETAGEATRPVHVFLTIDTEIWPLAENWPKTPLPPGKSSFTGEIDAYIRGKTPAGEFGLPFQLNRLAQHGLRATFFVETLFAGCAGEAFLREIVRAPLEGGHDVQLHVHTEWLGEISVPGLPAGHRQYLHQFALDEQRAIIAHARAALERSGAERPSAFRAGSYGANRDTLRALADLGFGIDSSYNPCYQESFPDAGEFLLQPRRLEGVAEFPVSSFWDYPGHRRPAQLGACSASEMTTLLTEAQRHRWKAVVIVWHSSELLKKEGMRRRPPEPHRVNIRRFESLCRFLGDNRQRFPTHVFSEATAFALLDSMEVSPVRTPLYRTAWRWLEQAMSRVV